jgi:hypothetical protein
MAMVLILCGLLALSGCWNTGQSRQPLEPKLMLPPGAQLVTYGQPAGLLLPVRTGGSFFFVDDQTGRVIWVYTHSATAPTTQGIEVTSIAPGTVGRVLKENRYYRVFYVPSPSTAY